MADDCVDRLMARLEDLFGGSPGSCILTAFAALHACARGGRSMASFLVAFEKAAGMLHEAGMTMADDNQAFLVHSLAGLSEHELVMAMTSATAAATATLTYKRMPKALMDLFGRKGTSTPPRWWGSLPLGGRVPDAVFPAAQAPTPVAVPVGAVGTGAEAVPTRRLTP